VKGAVAVVAVALAACATTDTLLPDQPRVVPGQEIAPYAFHEECAQLEVGDRLDFRFEAKVPVNFEVYYKDGIAFIATVSRESVTEFGAIFHARSARRYCLRWEAGPGGSELDYRVRLSRAAAK
jgi:hypothetical protein